MQLITQLRGVGCGLGVVVGCIGAFLVPCEARADDSASVPIPPVPELVETVLSTVEAAGEELPSSAAAAIPVAALTEALEPQAADEPSEEPKDDPSPTPVAETADMTTPDPSPPSPATRDTADDSVDITADIPETETTSPTEATAAASPSARPNVTAPVNVTAPANVNVSVRIDSPGANGAVTQTNAIPATSLPSSSSRIASSPASDERGAATPSPRVDAPNTTLSAAGPDDGESDSTSTWIWNWDCLSTGTLAPALPRDSDRDITPSNWTWNWNCDGNSRQYQNETAIQYQPINLNVSIRLSSPGDDGSVTQTTIIAASPGVTAQPMVQLPMPNVVLSLPALLLPPAASPFPLVNLLTEPAPASEPTPFAGALPVVILDDLDLDVALDAETPGLSDPEAIELVLRGSIPPREDLLATDVPTDGRHPDRVHRARHRQVTLMDVERGVEPTAGPLQRLNVALVPVARPQGGPGLETRAHEPPSPRLARPLPRWRLLDPVPSRQRAGPSGPSLVPAGAGGTSGGGLPIVLALPFIAALLDLARRVVQERMTWPSGYRSRMPDRPG